MVLLAHVVKLRGDLAWKLDAMLDGGIRLERFAFDLVEKVPSAPEELVVGELPSLRIRCRGDAPLTKGNSRCCTLRNGSST